ncbi:MAG: TonB-dependent receptor [Pseudomonadota bacterium]
MLRNLCLAAALAAIPAAAVSQSDDAVVVTATRFSEYQRNLPVGMTVYSREDIGSSGATTLPEFLARVPGLVTRNNSGSPDLQLDLRGFGASGDQNNVVLVNGVRISENELVPAKIQSIPLSGIERIEILRGAGAVPYGGGATGGAINIITRAPRARERELTLGAAVGGFGSSDLRASGAWANETLGVTLHANRYDTDNYRANNQLRQDNFEGSVRLFGRGSDFLALNLGSDRQNLRLPGVRTQAQLDTDPRGTATPRDYSTREGWHLDLAGSRKLGDVELAADLARRNRRATALFGDYFFGGLFDTFVDTRADTLSFTPRARIPFQFAGREGHVIVGYDHSDWDYASRQAGSPATITMPFVHTSASQENRAWFAQAHFSLARSTLLSAGVRAQRTRNRLTDVLAGTTQHRTDTPGAWELAMRHRLAAPVSVYGRLGASYRVPTVDENVFTPVGAAILQVQTSRDAEAGVEYRGGRLGLRAALYQNNLENEIHFNRLLGLFGANTNLSPTRRRGLETEASWQATAALRLAAALHLREARFRSGVYGGVDVTGNDVPMVPRRTASLKLAWQFAAKSAFVADLRYVGTQRYDNDQANTFPTLMPAYAVADIRVTHEVAGWRLAFSVNNLFDKRYYSYAVRNAAGTSFSAYPERPRWLSAVAEYQFR